jgi:hypothetical protein
VRRVHAQVRTPRLFLGLIAALVLAGGCRGPAGAALAPIPPEAQQHLGAALGYLRERELEADAGTVRTLTLAEQARTELQAAAALVPDWAAPQRLLDDLAREELALAARFVEHRRALQAAPGDPLALYLLGRLEVDGRELFQKAALIEPRSAWAHHALGVEHQRAGRLGAALVSAERALDRARGGYEAAWFARRLAQLERAAGHTERARRILGQVAERDDLPGTERRLLLLALARAELEAEDAPEVVERGFQRALELFALGGWSDRERADLLLAAQAGRSGRSEEAWQLELWRALQAGGWPAPTTANPQLLLGGRAQFLASLVALGRTEPGDTGPAARAAAFHLGRFGDAVERWRADLPVQVVDAQGLPRDGRLAAVVEAARHLGDGPGPERLGAFAELLLAAGWFEETRAVIAAFAAAGGDVDFALDLEGRARAGLALAGELAGLLEALHGGQRSFHLHPLDTPGQRRPRNLNALLTAIGRVVARYGPALGLDDPELGERIRRSPRLGYGPFARVVVPGPVFAERDEAMGLGPAGEPVPGLAEVLHGLGRAALVGQVTGRPADGSLLRLLHAEERSGTRLGLPFNGLVLWCEGADSSGGLGRMGNTVSGAALHEGYWIDLEAERRRHRRWLELQARWIDGRDPEALERVLAERGWRVAGPGASLERRAMHAPLGAADRLRLAILREREASAQPGAPRLALGELLELVAVHEEGHLVDRQRFLPLGRRPGAVLRFGLAHAFSPPAIERALEYRAQLVALCEVQDPRVALVDLLDSAEVPVHQAGVHARAYRDLLADLLEQLDAALEADPGALANIDRGRTLIHQWHRLGPEEVRRLALSLARRRGLIGTSTD